MITIIHLAYTNLRYEPATKEILQGEAQLFALARSQWHDAVVASLHPSDSGIKGARC